MIVLATTKSGTKTRATRPTQNDVQCQVQRRLVGRASVEWCFLFCSVWITSWTKCRRLALRKMCMHWRQVRCLVLASVFVIRFDLSLRFVCSAAKEIFFVVSPEETAAGCQTSQKSRSQSSRTRQAASNGKGETRRRAKATGAAARRGRRENSSVQKAATGQSARAVGGGDVGRQERGEEHTARWQSHCGASQRNRGASSTQRASGDWFSESSN